MISESQIGPRQGFIIHGERGRKETATYYDSTLEDLIRTGFHSGRDVSIDNCDRSRQETPSSTVRTLTEQLNHSKCLTISSKQEDKLRHTLSFEVKNDIAIFQLLREPVSISEHLRLQRRIGQRTFQLRGLLTVTPAATTSTELNSDSHRSYISICRNDGLNCWFKSMDDGELVEVDNISMKRYLDNPEPSSHLILFYSIVARYDGFCIG